MTTITSVAAYGRHGQFTIVRRDGTKRTDRVYTILDRNNRPVGQNWHFLRNARAQAAHMAAKLEAGQEAALGVLGLSLEGLAQS